jgi:hypothetical protein
VIEDFLSRKKSEKRARTLIYKVQKTEERVTFLRVQTLINLCQTKTMILLNQYLKRNFGGNSQTFLKKSHGVQKS